MLVDAWLPRAALAHPGRMAVGELSYAGLLELARAGREDLRGRGVAAGDRVAIALPPGELLRRGTARCLLHGAVAVPVDPRLSPSEAARLTAGAALVIDRPLETEARGEAGGGETHDLSATAILVHTSGTGGTPKPVELTYGNWLWSALAPRPRSASTRRNAGSAACRSRTSAGSRS